MTCPGWRLLDPLASCGATLRRQRAIQLQLQLQRQPSPGRSRLNSFPSKHVPAKRTRPDRTPVPQV